MPPKSRGTKTQPQKVDKVVDSKKYPVFALESKELQALRELADVVGQYLMDIDISHQDVADALYKVREEQDVFRTGN